MTEQEAHDWLIRTGRVSHETLRRLTDFAQWVVDETSRQNLVSRSTLDRIWTRHIVDSAQLLPLAPGATLWVDIGSGAGFPGLVIAIIDPERPLTLIEPRRLRADFLRSCVTRLGLVHVTIVELKSERVILPPASVISARAVAPLETLFTRARHLADDETIWLLPKGRNAACELAAVRKSWQGRFAMHPSVTERDASIVVATQVRPRSDR